ncbi:hypothetical protein C8F01DRAFT_1377800 [Mycena amicta]|nr:hypothetical protein C8F01DRAFT_1377800 [Mycena amicta]
MDHGKNLDSPIPAAGDEEIDLLSLLYAPINPERLFAPEQGPPPVAGYWSADIGSFGPTHDAHYSAEVASWALPAQSNPSFAAPDNAHIRTFDLLSSSPHWTPPRIFDAAPILPMPVFELSSPVRPPQGPREFDDDDRIISSSVRPPQRPRAPAIDSRSRSLSPLTSISDGSRRSPAPETVQPPHAEGCAICGQVMRLYRTCRGVAGLWCHPCYRYRLNHGIERPERYWNQPVRIFGPAPRVILPLPVLEPSSSVRPPQCPRESGDGRSLSPLTSISDSRSPTPEIAQSPDAKRCSICGQVKLALHLVCRGVPGLRCIACYRYRLKEGIERPEHLWVPPIPPPDDDACCSICGQVKPLRRSLRGVARLRCEPCYRYRLNHGIERPERYWNQPTRRHRGPPAADHVCGDCGGKTKQMHRTCLGMPGLRCTKCYMVLRDWIRWHRSRGLPVTSMPVRARPSSVPAATAEDIADEDIVDEDEVLNELLDIADEEEVRNALLDFTDDP